MGRLTRQESTGNRVAVQTSGMERLPGESRPFSRQCAAHNRCMKVYPLLIFLFVVVGYGGRALPILGGRGNSRCRDVPSLPSRDLGWHPRGLGNERSHPHLNGLQRLLIVARDEESNLSKLDSETVHVPEPRNMGGLR